VINDAPFTNALITAPWGGYKNTGIGKVHGEQGIKDLCREVLITRDRLGQIKQYWWFPYSQKQYELFKGLIDIITGDSLIAKARGLVKAVVNFLTMGKRI
jgi:succinate-semialdehyde dehydrogenase/glutarate-semialdehyde dehydrogenase